MTKGTEKRRCRLETRSLCPRRLALVTSCDLVLRGRGERETQAASALVGEIADIGEQPGQWLLRAKWAAGGGQCLQLSEERSAQGLGLEMSRRDRKYVNCLKDGSPPVESTSKTIMQVRALNIQIVINSPFKASFLQGWP